MSSDRVATTCGCDHRPAPRTLREIRLDAGESLRELELRCGVARGNLSQIETGKRVPTTREIVALEQAYGLRLAVRVQLVEVDTGGRMSRLSP